MLKRIIKSLFTSLAILAPVLATAAEKTAQDKGSAMNAMLIGLVALIIVLLFAIGILGNVLRQLALVYKEKLRKERAKVIAPVALLFMMLLGTAAHAEEAVAAAAPQAPAYISGIAASDFYLLIGIIALEMLVILSMLLSMRVLVRLLSNKPETEKVAKAIIRKPFWDKFNKAVAIEKEQDIMLDHDYDGIQELDNSLPPWWKYGFYLTIVVSVIYIYYYHMGGNGPSSYQEYVAEVEKGEADKAAYLAKSSGNVDENTVKMLDEAGIASGATIFQTACAACHAKDGGGGVGPNLTDEYWLHGGSLSDVFKSIKYGWPDKGMKSWKDDFSPKQIAELTSYIKSIKDTKPAAPKEKQGEIYQEAAGVDSTNVVATK